MYKIFDIFCGAGGMAEGFINAGFNIPYASDISEQAMKTYVNRHKQLGFDVNFINNNLNQVINDSNLMDELKRQKFDVVIGGPPCQGFSNAGKRSQKDQRNKLVLSYLKIIAELKPKYFVMENVKGIKSFVYDEITGISNKKYINVNAVEMLKKEFDLLGYNVNCIELNASDYGVPQNRVRIFFLGNLKELDEIGIPEKLEYKVTVEEAISDLITGQVESDYQKESVRGRTVGNNKKTIASNRYLNNEKSKHNDFTRERFSLFREGENFKNVLDRLGEIDKQKYITKKNSCRRIDRKTQAPTVVTLPDDYIHYSENRIMTVREMARLQSFDDSFEFLGKRTTGGKRRKFETPQYTLVGNAVPPLLSYAVAKKVWERLDGK